MGEGWGFQPLVILQNIPSALLHISLGELKPREWQPSFEQSGPLHWHLHSWIFSSFMAQPKCHLLQEALQDHTVTVIHVRLL